MRALIVLPVILLAATLAATKPVNAESSFRLHRSLDAPREANVPVCDDAKVLARMTKNFRRTNIRYRENALEFATVEKIRETDYLINTDELTPRRFCAAHVHLTDGTHPTVYYMIVDQGGFAGVRWGVNSCVSGHDPERAHGADCRSVRKPF